MSLFGPGEGLAKAFMTPICERLACIQKEILDLLILHN